MWRSGLARRRQQTAVSEMVTAASRSGNYVAPWRAAAGVWEHFRDEAEILRHLQHTWRHDLAGAVYVAIEQGQGDLSNDVTTAFETTSRRHSGVRKILEAHQDHPAIASAMRKERALLSCLVDGLATDSLGDLTAA